MNSDIDRAPLVAYESPNVDQFTKGFVTHMVCELRFPTLFDLVEKAPPRDVVRALRKTYPTLQAQTEINVDLGLGSNKATTAHLFRGEKGGWLASLKHSSVSVECKDYDGFEDLKRRVRQLVDAVQGVVETDRWLRLGLRYINSIPGDPSDGWINPVLAGAMLGPFRGLAESSGRLQLATETGGCLLQHRLHLTFDSDGAVKPAYIVDIDSFAMDIALDDTLARLESVHKQAFNLFDWCLGDTARAHLRG